MPAMGQELAGPLVHTDQAYPARERIEPTCRRAGAGKKVTQRAFFFLAPMRHGRGKGELGSSPDLRAPATTLQLESTNTERGARRPHSEC
ncbi:unnamed protein product [Urochloa humidicola]